MRRAPPSLVLGVALVFALLGTVGFATQSSEAGQAQGSRVIDRTVRCTVPLRAGLRLVSVSGQSGVRDQDDPSQWFAIASVSLSVQGAGLALAQAGTPRSERTDRVPQFTESFWIHTRACRPVAARISFGPRGLGGGPLNQFSERYKCTTPKRVLLRVRGEFRSPVTLRLRDGILSTAEPLTKGQVAMRTERGKPLLYADVVESGKGRLFFTGNCVRA
jgi:hypothetical protein